MRGSEAMPPAFADKAATEGEVDPNESMEEQDVPGMVAKHVYGPDENGHHHLNLTTFAQEHASKHRG